MDYQFSSFVIYISLVLSILVILRIWKTRIINHSTSVSNLPPGPWKLPLIGNMHLLFGRSLPHHCLSKLAKKYGPLMHLQLGEVSHIIVSSPETAKEVMKTYDINFAQRPALLAASVIFYNYSDIAFSPYGNYWRQLRKICTLELLSVKRVKSFQRIREEEVSNFIRSIYSVVGSPINLSKMALSLANDIAARAAFGERCKDKEAFLLILRRILEIFEGFSLPDLFPSIKLFEFLSGMRSKLKRLHQEEDKIIENIITEHESNSKRRKSTDEEENLLDVLLSLQEDRDLDFRLTTDNIKAIIMDMFSGGSETSSRVIEWAMSELLKNSRVLEKVQEEVRRVFNKKGNVVEAGLPELQYLNLVIKETLRLHPPLPLLLPRECRGSCKINGYDIPVGTKVIVNAWAMGRDPNYWDEAERFYPERFLESSMDYKGNCFEYIPFGAGRRMCPGIQFGIIEVELALAQLLYHFNWELPHGEKNEDLDMTEAFGVSVGRKNDLYVVPIPYDPHFSE